MSSPRYITPACTFSAADDGLRGEAASELWMKSQVPGRICITPRALALDTRALLKPLSCRAIAVTSDGSTPCEEAIGAIWAGVTHSRVGCGAAPGTAPAGGAAAGRAGDVEPGAPVGSLRGVPARRTLFGSRPFIQASCDRAIPLRAAIA